MKNPTSRPTINSQLQNDIFRHLCRICAASKDIPHIHDNASAIYDLLWSATVINEK
jgi:hypothetical protein